MSGKVLRILMADDHPIVLAGLKSMYDAYGYPSFAPPPLLAEHAAAGIEFRTIGPGRRDPARTPQSPAASG